MGSHRAHMLRRVHNMTQWLPLAVTQVQALRRLAVSLFTILWAVATELHPVCTDSSVFGY